jgi:hypothetical protein
MLWRRGESTSTLLGRHNNSKKISTHFFDVGRQVRKQHQTLICEIGGFLIDVYSNENDEIERCGVWQRRYAPCYHDASCA